MSLWQIQCMSVLSMDLNYQLCTQVLWLNLGASPFDLPVSWTSPCPTGTSNSADQKWLHQSTGTCVYSWLLHFVEYLTKSETSQDHLSPRDPTNSNQDRLLPLWKDSSFSSSSPPPSLHISLRLLQWSFFSPDLHLILTLTSEESRIHPI